MAWAVADRRGAAEDGRPDGRQRTRASRRCRSTTSDAINQSGAQLDTRMRQIEPRPHALGSGGHLERRALLYTSTVMAAVLCQRAVRWALPRVIYDLSVFGMNLGTGCSAVAVNAFQTFPQERSRSAQVSPLALWSSA